MAKDKAKAKNATTKKVTKKVAVAEKPTKKSKKAARAAKLAAREEKKKSRKGDGSFPDTLVVTKERTSEGDSKKTYFLGHGEDMETLYKNGETVAVYKLRRVSTISIKRKVVR